MNHLAQEHLEDILLFCNKKILQKTRNFQTQFFKNKTKYNYINKNTSFLNVKWLFETKQNEINYLTQNDIFNYAKKGSLNFFKYIYSIDFCIFEEAINNLNNNKIIVNYIKQLKSEFNKTTLNKAISGGHNELVNFLQSKI